MSGLSVATFLERCIRLERTTRMFEVHTVKEEGKEEALGTRKGRVGVGEDEGGEGVGDGRVVDCVGDCRRPR